VDQFVTLAEIDAMAQDARDPGVMAQAQVRATLEVARAVYSVQATLDAIRAELAVQA
jgi:hypothetical protein